MTPFDLIFAAALLFVAGSLLWIGAQFWRGSTASAIRQLRRLLGFFAVYLCVEVSYSLFSPPRVLVLGETRSFDDWCLTVSSAETADHLGPVRAPPDKFVVLTLKVFSTARGISQSAPNPTVHLLAAGGRRFEVDPGAQSAYERDHGAQTPLNARLGPLGSFVTVRVFRVPRDTRSVDVVTPHGGGPGRFIIADDSSLLHRPTVFRIALAP